MDPDELQQRILAVSGESLKPLLSALDDLISESSGSVHDETKRRFAQVLTSKYAHEPTEVRATIVWILGKLRLPSMKSFFEAVLKEEVEVQSDVLWQAIVALDNLGVQILSETGGGGILDRRQNAEIAHRYLRGRGN